MAKRKADIGDKDSVADKLAKERERKDKEMQKIFKSVPAPSTPQNAAQRVKEAREQAAEERRKKKKKDKK